MSTKLYNLPDVVEGLPPGSVTADGDGEWIDTLNYEGVLGFTLHTAATAGSSPTLDVKLVHSEDQSTVADVTGGAFTQRTDADSSAAVIETLHIQKNALRRYVRYAKNIAGSSAAFATSATMIGHKKYNAGEVFNT